MVKNIQMLDPAHGLLDFFFLALGEEKLSSKNKNSPGDFDNQFEE